MDIYLGRKEFVDSERHSVFPICEEIVIVRKQEDAGLIIYIGGDLPYHVKFTVATDFTSGVAVGCNIELCVIDFISDAGFQVIREWRYSGGQL